MNGLKSLGVVILVFVVWTVAAVGLMSQQHIGQVYDPTYGMWFTDRSVEGQYVQAHWFGQAISMGFVVALVAGVVFFFRKGLARLSR